MKAGGSSEGDTPANRANLTKTSENDAPPQVLVCVPRAEDAAILEQTVSAAGGRAHLCSDFACLSGKLAAGADAIIVSEEMLGSGGVALLASLLTEGAERPETPVLLLTGSGRDSELARQLRGRLDNVLLFERPVRLANLEGAVRMALRARRRQRVTTELLEERRRLNAELEQRVEALRQSEDRFRRLYEANIVGIVSANPDTIYDANQVFLDILGFTHEDLEAGLIKWRELTPGEYWHPDECGIEELLSTGSMKPFEKEFFRKDGSRVPVLIGAVLLEKSPARWLGFVVDLTARKQLERRILEAQKLESVGLLAGGLAHDFNNLLTGIMGNASMLVDDVEPRQTAQIEAILSNAERCADLTRQLLAYAGQGRFIERDIDASQAIREMLGLIQSSIPRSARLKLSLETRLPLVRIDPGQLNQVLMNLVINAGEAIGEGNPGEIAVCTTISEIGKPFVDALGRMVEAGRYVSIEVSDTGSGVDEKTKARIFDPFFSTKFMGRGLGLAAVAGIVRSQNGAITVESAPGRGSTFQVLLPAAEARFQEPGAAPRARILVVDDEPSVRDIISSVLSRQGFRVYTASNGQEALAIAGREGLDIDAAIVDVVIPVTGASDLLSELKAQRPKVAILLTSGYSESEVRRFCAAYPGAPFIQKPYTAQQIAVKVRELLGQE